MGINRLSGKAQCFWLIEPVYADKNGKSPNTALLAATSRTLGGFLDHDPNFAHRFSRSPFYTGDSPDRYIWYRQHHRIDRLSDFIREVREVADEPQHVSPARSSPGEPGRGRPGVTRYPPGRYPILTTPLLNTWSKHSDVCLPDVERDGSDAFITERPGHDVCLRAPEPRRGDRQPDIRDSLSTPEQGQLMS